jgi:protein-S-isoprenylcysteine O-methyltransferase Ste14
VTILLLGGIIARLLDEERYLSANLPGYADYCRKVRYRLVPLVW